jgi:predicted SAM-dependent methyltransferase
MKERTFIRKMLSKLRTSYRKVFYFGLSYKCPFCNSNLRTFLPHGLNFPVLKEKKVVGGGYRQNAICPICDSHDRERLLYLYLLYKTDLFQKSKKLLHIAPEPRLKIILRSKINIDYLSADISKKNVMVKMDITNIEFPNNSFDVIICNHVLEHIIEDGKAISELYRTLKPKGWAILQVPISLTLKNTYEDFSIITIPEREKAFGQGDHVRIYSKDYQERLTQAGFKVYVFKWKTEAENFGGKRNKFGLNGQECIYFAAKP